MRLEDGRRRFGLLCAVLALCGAGGAAGDDAVLDLPLPTLVGADLLHADGITGRGVTIAAIAGVTPPGYGVRLAADGHDRLLARYDVVRAAEGEPSAVPGGAPGGEDVAHLAVMLSSRRDAAGRPEGIAPDADLVLVRALGADGSARPADVARAVDWVVSNRDRFGVRVLHLPLAVPAGGPLVGEPLGRALVDAWQAGIVVVTAAGSGDPAPRTPDVLRLPRDGTAISSAVVSGVVALMLEASPWLTPEEVKERLAADTRGLTLAERGLLGITWAD